MIKTYNDFTNNTISNSIINEKFNLTALKTKDNDFLIDLLARAANSLVNYSGEDFKDTLGEIEMICAELQDRDIG